MNSIQAQVHVLCKIQDIELRRQELLHRVNNTSTKVLSIENQIVKCYDDLEGEEEFLVSFEQKYREAEDELDFLNTSISKSRRKIVQVKNNKEYKSSLKEIEVLNKKRENLEDNMLKYLQEIEDAKILVSKKMKLLLIRKERLISEKEAVLDEKSKMRVLWGGLGEKVKDIRKSINLEILSIFDNLAERVNNKPVSQVSNSICLGCNMQIPYQMFIELQKFIELRFCPHCGRIIYRSDGS